MATILSQSMDGSWKLTKIKHNKEGKNLVIRGATVSYNGVTVPLPDIKDTETATQLQTGWVTKVGMSDSEVRAMENEINDSFSPNPYPAGNVLYTVIADFECIPYTPVEPIHEYRLRIDPEESIIESDGVTALTAYFVTDSVLPGRVVTTLSNWSIVEGGDYAFIGNTTTKKGSVTGNNQTDEIQPVRVKATYEFEGETYEAYAIVRVKPVETPEPPAPEIKVSDISIQFDCEDNDLFPITVTASIPWTVTVSRDAQSWLTIQDITAAGFNVKVTDNHVENRTGYISVTSVGLDEGIGVDITVTQPFCDDTPVPTFNVDTTPITTLCSSNEPYWVSVTAENTDWEVEVTAGGEWISIANKANNGFNVIVLDNTGAERDGTIRVTPTAEGLATKTIAVSQPDCTPVPDSITINPDSGIIPCDVSDDTRYHFNITANVEWGFDGDVETTYDWIHIVETGETYFELKFEKNDAPDAVDRTANIRIIAGTAAATVTIRQDKCQEGPIFEPFDSLDKFSAIPCPGGTFYFRIRTNLTEELVLESDDMEENGWITLEEVASQEEGIRVIAATFQENGLSERYSTITVTVKNRPDITAISIPVTQLACEEAETFDVDDSDIHFECNDSMYSLQISATDGVTWTATTSDNRFGVYLGSENPSQEVTGTGSEMLHITPLTDNRNVRYDIEGTLRIQSSLGDDVTINLYQAPTPVLEYDGQTQLQFSKNGGTKTLTFKTNFDVNVSISQSTNWLSYTKGNLGSTADDGLQIEFSANENPTESQLSATVTISTAYDGNCEKPSNIVIYMYQEEGDPYIPPIPGAEFNVTGIYGDFPYYAELGGYTHEYSLMDEEFYSSCGLSAGDVGGVVYLMPLRACAIQVYYDTNVDLSNLTYEIVHVSPQNPEQEWLEVVMDPEEYEWSDEDSNHNPYPGDFILIKTRDNFQGSSLYNDEYTGYVKIKVKSTGQVLKTIPVKCIKVDINSESVKVSDSVNGSRKSKITIGSSDNPAVGAAGGFVNVWVYTNDSAYFSDHPDSDVSWNNLSFYYEDGETKIPVEPDQDPSGMDYIDKIYDTRCNTNELLHVKVKVGPNCQFSDVTRGFELSTENAGYLLIDGGNEAEVKIVQARNRTSESNYRIEEFFTTNNGMTPVWDDAHQYGGEYKYITGATCDGTGHTITPTIKILYDQSELCNPGVITPKEPLNDYRVIYDETRGYDIANPNVIEANIQYVNDTGWIYQNPSYRATTGQPFEFYLQPYTGYTDTADDGSTERTAIITVTYKNCAPQITRQLRITQSYMKVEMTEVNMKLYSGGSPSTSYVDAATGSVSSSGYVIINNQSNNYIYLAGEEGVTVNVVITNTAACTFESITDSNGSQAGQNYVPYILASSWCELFIKNTAPAGTNYTITINCMKTGKTMKTLTINVQV